VPQRIIYAAILGALLLIGGATPACATGYWNMPSTFCQCVGCGFGAGHHAPFILGPVTYDGWFATNERRLPYPPSPPYCGHCAGNCGGRFAEPTMMEPAPAPAPVAPEVVPTSRRHRPLFLR
jgi:hypothetical protein